MKKKYKIGIIGSGKLSSAILESWLENKIFKKNEIWAATSRRSTADKIAKKYKIKATHQYLNLIENTEILLLGVKPYQLKDVCRTLSENNLKENTLVLSLAAGVGTQQLSHYLGSKNPVILTMTNTPCQISQGMTAIVKGNFAKQKDLFRVKKMFSACGETIILKEKYFHEYTSIAASSPAFIFFLMNCFIKSGQKMGMNDKELKLIVSQAFLGTAKLLQNSNKKVEELISQVTTPGGCTAEGMKVLDSSDALTLLYKTLDKTKEKSKMMAKS